MENAVRIYQVRQALSDKQLGLLSTMSRSDLCFFRFTGGNTSETEQLAEQLFRLKATGVLLIGIFRFPFRFEGKKRLQTAIVQYHQMKDLCDAMTLGRRFQITLVVKGLTDPFPRPVKMQRFQHQRLWMKRQWANMAKKRQGRSWFPLIHNNQVGPGERQRAGE